VISNCLTCVLDASFNVKCNTCSLGYQVKSNVCVAICGDGIVIAGSEPCDDGNLVNLDGCDKTCQI
jgi:cysteine-rich repeat protein